MYRSYCPFNVISTVCSDTVKHAGPAADWNRVIPVVYTQCNVAQHTILSDNGSVPTFVFLQYSLRDNNNYDMIIMTTTTMMMIIIIIIISVS